MVVVAQSDKYYSIHEYLELESHSSVKHFYYNGKIVEMPGSDVTHNKIAVRIMSELLVALDTKEKEYHVLNSDQKIHIPEYNQFVYPDAVVICEKIEYYPGSNAIVNPILVVEVLSPSTEAFDRAGKFLRYKTLPSFKEYVLVRQDKPWVSSSFREKPGIWRDTQVESLSESILLPSIDCSLLLSRVYQGVSFDQ